MKNYFSVLVKKIDEVRPKHHYQVADIFRCGNTEKLKVVLHVTCQRFAFSKYLEDVINDDSIITELDQRSVRSLTQLAAIEKANPEMMLASETYGESTEFKIKKKGAKEVIDMSLRDFIEEHNLIKKFNALDAYKIGYKMGAADELELSQLKARLKQ